MSSKESPNFFKIENIRSAISNLKDKEDLPLLFKSFKVHCDDLILTKTGLSMKGIEGAPDWYSYESQIWESAFNYIEPLLKIKKYRGENPLLDGLLKMGLEKKYGKGRQALIILITKYGSVNYASSLAPLIDDPDLSIHIIAALTKMNDLSQYEKIKEMSESKKLTPKRTYARKYIKKVKVRKEGESE